LFMDRPAERPEELFDRREEVEQLRRAAAARQLALVVGMRRIGKTSVVKAGTYGRPRIYIDARSFEERPYISYADLLEALRRELRRLLPMHKRLGELLAKVRGVSVAGVEVRFEAGRSAPGLSELLQVLDEWAGDRGERLFHNRRGAGAREAEGEADTAGAGLRLRQPEEPLHGADGIQGGASAEVPGARGS